MIHLPNLPIAKLELAAEDLMEIEQVGDGVGQEIQQYLNYLESIPLRIPKPATFLL
jgi:hypothetical protein